MESQDAERQNLPQYEGAYLSSLTSCPPERVRLGSHDNMDSPQARKSMEEWYGLEARFCHLQRLTVPGPCKIPMEIAERAGRA
jgi:hypothetical protein